MRAMLLTVALALLAVPAMAQEIFYPCVPYSPAPVYQIRYRYSQCVPCQPPIIYRRPQGPIIQRPPQTVPVQPPSSQWRPSPSTAGDSSRRDITGLPPAPNPQQKPTSPGPPPPPKVPDPPKLSDIPLPGPSTSGVPPSSSTRGIKPACQCPKLSQRLSGIEQAIANIKPGQCDPAIKAELAAIKKAISELQTGGNPNCQGDLNRIEDRLANIERAVQALPTECPKVDLSRIEDRLANIERALQNPQACDLTAVLQGIQAIEEKLAAIQPTPTDLTGIEQQLTDVKEGLTELGGKIDNASVGQTQIGDSLAEVATAQAGTNAKLAEAIELLKKGGTHEVVLTVQSTPNLPASYVDTSTIWAVQRRTGLSHVVIVINSEDPDWARLEPEYVKARHKFPAMQLVDVASSSLKISPTPQLVLYYADKGRKPEILSGDRDVGAKLRELYTN